jgi:hypothetical protein
MSIRYAKSLITYSLFCYVNTLGIIIIDIYKNNTHFCRQVGMEIDTECLFKLLKPSGNFTYDQA